MVAAVYYSRRAAVWEGRKLREAAVAEAAAAAAAEVATREAAAP